MLENVPQYSREKVCHDLCEPWIFQICCLCVELITGINRIPSFLFSEIASEIMKSPGQSEVIDSGMYINCVTK